MFLAKYRIFPPQFQGFPDIFAWIPQQQGTLKLRGRENIVFVEDQAFFLLLQKKVLPSKLIKMHDFAK